jgi:small-conductance mechanosensitive channel
MDMSKLSQGWQNALGQFVDIASPFGRARVVVSLILILLAVLVGLTAADDRPSRRLSPVEVLIGYGMAMIIGLNTLSALTGTLSQVLVVATGRPLGGRDAIDLVLAACTFMACLLLWGLLGLGLMAFFRGLGSRLASLMGRRQTGPEA